MVGLFTLSSSDKRTPPNRQPRHSDVVPQPSYNESPIPPIFLAETTTTRTEVVTTTTQTTTHLFSLPLWKRRGGSTTSVPARPTTYHAGASEDGAVVRSAGRGSTSFMTEKELPPTPANHNDVCDHEAVLGTPTYRTDVAAIPWLRERALPTRASSYDSRNASIAHSPLSPSQSSTAVLAQAALGLGLPHVLPHASSSSSTSVNSVQLVSPDATPAEVHLAPRLRKAKSFQKLLDSSSEPFPVSDNSSEDAPRRSRGVSFGTTSFLQFSISDAKGKGKEKEKAGKTQVSAPQTLTRRASFWLRKKSMPALEPAPIIRTRHVSNNVLLTPLPSVQPVSPFNIETALTSRPNTSSGAGSLSSHHSRGLSRSLSERAGSHRLSPRTAEEIPDVPRRGNFPVPNRPATADPLLRNLAPKPSSNKTNQTQSVQPLSSSLSRPLEESPSPRSSVHVLTPTRPRAATNPPVPQRFSLNLFASSTIPSTDLIPLDSNHTSPSLSSSSSPRPSTTRPPTAIPKPLTSSESPEVYLTRLTAAVSKAEIASVLAAR